MGWNASTLAPLVHAELNDVQATSPTSFFLSSVWMSGFGIAGMDKQIFFSTGNSDCNLHVWACPSQSTYDGVTNIQESVISMQPNLAQRTGVFTPSNVFQMDMADADLGAAGVLLIPQQSDGSRLAAIVSKDGRLFLLDQTNLSAALDTQQLAAGCWCGPSYFHGSDGISRVVSSAGDTLQTWQIQTAPTRHLIAEASAFVQQSGQDPGFFTVVSSSNARLNTAIIWAVARPTGSTPLMLYAFAAAPSNGTLKQLYSAAAGQWPNLSGNANIVPLVANGKVYVAAYETLMIFGPNAPAVVPAAVAAAASASARKHPFSESDAAVPALPLGATQRVSGTLIAIDGTALTLSTRTGRIVSVDAARAIELERVATLQSGQAYTALCAPAPDGSADGLQAVAVMRAKQSPATWPNDR
jgi:hypothetical protein